jgi:hypothetical protein
MKYKVKRVHFVGIGGADTSRKQGPAALGAAGCDRPRVAPAADGLALNSLDEMQ